MSDKRDKLRGVILGGVLGDAYGSAFEGQGALLGVDLESCRRAKFTDDTQLTLATCEALVDRNGGELAERVAKAFLRWYSNSMIRGVGSSTLGALRNLSAGAPWYASGAGGEKSAGNGAAMRIAPLAFLNVEFEDGFDDGYRLVREVAGITHRNDEAYVGALVIYLIVRGLLNGGDMDDLIKYLPDDLPDSRVRDQVALLPGMFAMSLEEAAAVVGTSGYVVESVPFSVLAARRALCAGMQRMLVEVISCGGDTDTNASMAGQMAGAVLGEAGLPTDLLQQVRDMDVVYAVLAELEREAIT